MLVFVCTAFYLLSPNDLIFHHLPYTIFDAAIFIHLITIRGKQKIWSTNNTQEKWITLKRHQTLFEWIFIYVCLRVFASSFSSSIHWFFMLHKKIFKIVNWKSIHIIIYIRFCVGVNLLESTISTKCCLLGLTYCNCVYWRQMHKCVRVRNFCLINDLVVFCLERRQRGVQSKFQTSKYLKRKDVIILALIHTHTFITLIANLISIYMVWCLFSLWMDHPICWIKFKSWFLFALTQWNKMLSDLTRKTILAIMYQKIGKFKKLRGSLREANRLYRINVICSTKDYIGYCQFGTIKCGLYTFETSILTSHYIRPVFFPCY